MSTTIERYVIRHISGTKANQVEEFDFSKNELSIGRTAGSDIQFDPEQEVIVSREHGKIVKVSSEPPQFSINDNNSRNGIFVNKMRVKGSAPLKPGDEVQLGSNGPVFSFDIHPRPQNMMMETKVMDIPTSIKATTVSEVASAAAEPAKTGLGKQTVERMLVAERKKSFSSMAYILGALIIVLGALGYFFRDKIFGKNTTTIVNVGDSSMKNKKAPDVIAKENNDKVVQIEFGWQLIEANSGQDLWHQYMALKDQSGQVTYRAVYVENARGEIEPYLDLQKNVQLGVPLGIAGAFERHDQHQHVHPRAVPGPGHVNQRIAAFVDPPVIGIDAQKRIGADQRQRLDQPAAGIAQQFALIRNGHLEIAGMGGKVGFNLIGQVVDIDHDSPDPGFTQLIEHVIDQRRSRHFDQRLGAVGGQRHHPRALARGHDHRGVRDWGTHPSNVPPPMLRSTPGTLASNHFATGSSAG